MRSTQTDLEPGNEKIEQLEALFELSLIVRNQFHLEKFEIDKNFHRVSSFAEFLGIRKFRMER